MRMNNSLRRQQGMTIMELMIALVLGMIVLGAVLSVYISTVGSSGDTLKMSRLNQEVAALMNVMANDIRRAGYARADGVDDWDDPDGTDPDDLDNYMEPSTNPFNQRGSTALEVHNAADVDQEVQGDGPCIVYSYDADRDGTTDDNESYGFRLNAAGDAVQMRQSINSAAGDVSNACDDGEWDTISDDNSVVVTELTFDLGESTCIITLEPDDVDNNGNGETDDIDERDCYAHDLEDPAKGSGGYRDTYPLTEVVPIVEVRHVEITLKAELADDPDVKTTQQQRVAVRNNLVRLVP